MPDSPSERQRLIRSVDFETTGMDPAVDRVVEIGYTDIRWVETVGANPDWNPNDPKSPTTIPLGGRWIVERPRTELIDPQRKIPPQASGVHHITDNMVAGKPTFSQAAPCLLTGGPILCAHNAAFEKKWFTTPAQWICTWKGAVVLAPHAPEHKLQTLRYWLKLDLDVDEADPPHRAGPDSYVAAHLLVRMLTKLSVDELIAIEPHPVILPRFRFGEHQGKPIDDIPSSYLEWMLRANNPPFNEDERATATHHLKLREQIREG